MCRVNGGERQIKLFVQVAPVTRHAASLHIIHKNILFFLCFCGFPLFFKAREADSLGRLHNSLNRYHP